LKTNDSDVKMKKVIRTRVLINLPPKQNNARLMTKAEIRHIIVLHDGLMRSHVTVR